MSGRPCDLMRDDLTPDWCDPVAVARALNSQPVGRPLHHAERVEVARQLIARGDGAARLAILLGCNGPDARELIEEAKPVDLDTPIDLWPAEVELDIDSPIDLWPTDDPRRELQL